MAQKIRGRTLPHLRAWRSAKLLTQIELAERAGVSRFTVKRAEHGDTIVGYASIRKLAAALGISAEELLGAPPS